MLPSDVIVGIYNYLGQTRADDSHLPNLPSSAYYLLYLFDKNGLLERDLLKRLYEEMFFSLNKKFDDVYIGPFDSLETLHQFALRVCVKIDAGKAQLFAVKDYNAIIETANDIEDLQKALVEKGITLENVEKMNRKKGLLGKIFS
jgi:hypothetical protein